MSYSPILAAHICAGTMGLLSGTAALSMRKGSTRHAFAGKVFVASMLTMAVAAVYPLRLLTSVGLGKHLPPALFSTSLYLILTILPLIMLIFWLVRIRFKNAAKKYLMAGGVPSLRT